MATAQAGIDKVRHEGKAEIVRLYDRFDAARGSLIGNATIPTEFDEGYLKAKVMDLWRTKHELDFAIAQAVSENDTDEIIAYQTHRKECLEKRAQQLLDGKEYYY